jgi:Fe-S-cluster containining protein
MGSRYPSTLRDKFLNHYFVALARSKTLVVKQNLASAYHCHCCGACCSKFSLDYLPFESRPDTAVECSIEYGTNYIFYSDTQKDNKSNWCRHLSHDARCKIYEHRPLSCDFEMIRVSNGKLNSTITVDRYMHPHYMVQYMLHQHARIPGDLHNVVERQYRPLCTKRLALNQSHAYESIRKLRRLQSWADYFHIDTWIPEIIEYLATGGWLYGDAVFSKR